MAWPILGAIAGAAASGGIQHWFNERSAEKSRDWQEYMSNTSYQRAANDLEAAGLNRVLALGQGASTPSGATASIQNPRLSETGIMAASAKQQIAQSQAEEKLISQREQESKATETLAISNAMTAQTQADLNRANTALAAETARLKSAEATKQERFTPVYDKIGQGVEALINILESKFTSSAKDATGESGVGAFIKTIKNAPAKIKESINRKMWEMSEDMTTRKFHRLTDK